MSCQNVFFHARKPIPSQGDPWTQDIITLALNFFIRFNLFYTDLWVMGPARLHCATLLLWRLLLDNRPHVFLVKMSLEGKRLWQSYDKFVINNRTDAWKTRQFVTLITDLTFIWKWLCFGQFLIFILVKSVPGETLWTPLVYFWTSLNCQGSRGRVVKANPLGSPRQVRLRGAVSFFGFEQEREYKGLTALHLVTCRVILSVLVSWALKMKPRYSCVKNLVFHIQTPIPSQGQPLKQDITFAEYG